MSHLTFLYSCVPYDMSVLISEKDIEVLINYVQMGTWYEILKCGMTFQLNIWPYIYIHFNLYFTCRYSHTTEGTRRTRPGAACCARSEMVRPLY